MTRPDSPHGRVITRTRTELLDERRDVIETAGINLAWLEQLASREGTAAATSWLEEHNFAAEAWVWDLTTWLLDGVTPTPTDQQA